MVTVMNKTPTAHHYVSAIKPYQLGRSTGELAQALNVPVNAIVRLAANENCLGMSSKVQQVVEQFIKDGARYPEVSVLQKTIATYHHVDPARVIPGNGSCEILELIARTFLNPDKSSVYPEQSFVMYKLATMYMGAAGIAVKARPDYSDDLSGLLAAIRPDTQVVWISTVNNPTGALNPYAELKTWLAQIPPHIIVVLDEAYAEYLPDEQQANTVAWIDEFPNLVVTRTFSKIYGLAGLRIGYGIASTVVADMVNRMRGPYNCNSLGIAAAIAALDDQSHVQQSRLHNQHSIRQLTDGLKKLGYSYLPAWGNFVTVEVEDAMSVHQQLLQQGVVVLPLNGYNMPRHIRVSAGLESENHKFLDAFGKVQSSKFKLYLS